MEKLEKRIIEIRDDIQFLDEKMNKTYSDYEVAKDKREDAEVNILHRIDRLSRKNFAAQLQFYKEFFVDVLRLHSKSTLFVDLRINRNIQIVVAH